MLVIVKVCDRGHQTDMGPHVGAWEMKHAEFRECPECGSENTDFCIDSRKSQPGRSGGKGEG
jgi:hypothetical protein